MEQAVVTSDNDGLVTSLNERPLEPISTTGESVGKSLRQLTDRVDFISFRAEAESHAGHSLVKEHSIMKGSGHLCLRTFCQPLRDADGRTIGNVFQLRDVTADRHLQDRAGRMERFMGLGSLAVGLHHEIKNPLAAVSLHVQLVEESLAGQALPDDVPEMLAIVKAEMKRIEHVLENLRDYASAERLHLVKMPLTDLLVRQVDLMRPLAEAAKVNLQLCVGDDLTEPITFDATRVEQIVHNLMVNAIEAMPDGGELTIHVMPVRGEDADGVLLKFADTGPVIPESIRSHVFDAYFTTKGGGTGMGLALSDKVARLHGGRLGLTVVDDGTTFELFLPIRPSELPARHVS